MCGGSEWNDEPWRPFSALHRDLLGLRRQAFHRDGGRMPTPERAPRHARTIGERRELNGRIALLSRSLGQPRETYVEFVCECEHEDCEAMLRLTLDEYAALRSADDYLAVVPGHQAPTSLVVAYSDRYVFVRSSVRTPS